MDASIFKDVLVFVGVIVAMGCFTGIVVSLINRGKGRQLSPQTSGRLDEIADRLARIETAVDATSVEVERISEGQRFTTKLLAEGAPSLTALNRGRQAGPS